MIGLSALFRGKARKILRIRFSHAPIPTATPSPSNQFPGLLLCRILLTKPLYFPAPNRSDHPRLSTRDKSSLVYLCFGLLMISLSDPPTPAWGFLAATDAAQNQAIGRVFQDHVMPATGAPPAIQQRDHRFTPCFMPWQERQRNSMFSSVQRPPRLRGMM